MVTSAQQTNDIVGSISTRRAKLFCSSELKLKSVLNVLRAEKRIDEFVNAASAQAHWAWAYNECLWNINKCVGRRVVCSYDIGASSKRRGVRFPPANFLTFFSYQIQAQQVATESKVVKPWFFSSKNFAFIFHNNSREKNFDCLRRSFYGKWKLTKETKNWKIFKAAKIVKTGFYLGAPRFVSSNRRKRKKWQTFQEDPSLVLLRKINGRCVVVTLSTVKKMKM